MKRLGSKLILITCMVSIIIPIVFLIIWSLSSRWAWPLLCPKEISIKWWIQVLSNKSEFYKTLQSTIVIGVITSFIGIIIAIPIGSYISGKSTHFKKIIEALFFLPIILSPMTITLGLYQTLSRLNLTGKIIGVIIAHLIPCLPYGIRIMKVSFEHFNQKYLEQAQLLGANNIQRQLYVTLPMIKGGIIASFHLMLLISMSQYILTIFVGTGKIQTLATRMYPFLNGGNMSIGAVYSLIFAIIAITLLVTIEIFLKRHLSKKQ